MVSCDVAPPLQWYVLAIATTWLNGATLGFMAWREGERALRSWSFAWIAWGLAAIPLAMIGPDPAHPLEAVLCGFLWVASTLGFLQGTYRFSGRAMPRIWYGVALGCAVLAIALGIGPSGAAGMLPLVLFQSVGLLLAGVLNIRAAAARTGAWLCGIALTGLGLHVLDTPILASQPGLLRWGFVVAIGLQVLAALGMLMLYYEHARATLLETQRVMEQSRRIEALGRIAGGVAHDFNNILTVMQGHVELIRAAGADGAMDKSLLAIERAVDQASRLTKQLLAFGQRSIIQAQAIDVREVVERTLELLERVIPERIQLRMHCGAESFRGRVDQALLEQIVLNLVTNARDAIAGQGSILVELERIDLPSTSIVIRVIDDGAGMDGAVLKRVFEPFFTSKPSGRGTGLGLASVQGAVAQLGGRIRVESQVGQGSRFEVTLPLVEADPAPPSRPELPRSGPLDILIVDDDEGVRQITAEVLESAGHSVERAENGRAALDRIRERAFDVVLSDVVMPGMGGVELLKEAARLRPHMPVVLTSGYPRDAGLDADKVTILPKPFRAEKLLDLVERVAAERRAALPRVVRS